MDFLYSLYDALVGINVPSDKARAVVDAMERDMGTTLATKQDLEKISFATTQDLEKVSLAAKQDLEKISLAAKRDLEVQTLALRKDIDVLRLEMKQEFEAQRRDTEGRFALVDEKIDRLRSDVSRDMAALDLKMTVKLGSMLFVGFGLTIAALRIWS